MSEKDKPPNPLAVLGALAASPLAGKVVEGGLSLIGSLFGAKSQRKSVQDTNALNAQLARETNDMNWNIARYNNEMQLGAMRENNEFNRQQAIDMFNMEAAYNSPENQKKLLLAGGYNPATMYQNGGQIAATNAATPSAASSGISPTAPSLVTPHMETPPSVIGSMFPMIESFTKSLANVAQSGLNNAQKKKLTLTMDAELQSILASADHEKAQASWQKLQNTLEGIYGSAQRNANLRKTVEDAWNSYSNAVLAAEKGNTEKAQQLLLQAETDLKKSNNDLLQKQMPALVLQAEETVNLIREQQATEKSKQNANNAAAAHSVALANLTTEQYEQLNAMENDIVAIKNLERWQLHKQFNLLRDTYEAQKAQYLNMGLISEQQLKQIEAEASRSEKENSAFWFTYCFDKIERTLKAGAAWIPFTNPGSSGSAPSYYSPMWSTSTSH